TNVDLAFYQSCVELQPSQPAIRQPRVEAAEPAGGQRFPSEAPRSGLGQSLVKVPQIDRGNAFELIASQSAAAVPDCLAYAATIFRAFPDDPDAPTERRRIIGPPSLQHIKPVADFEPLDRGGCYGFDREFRAIILGAQNVAHHRPAHCGGCRGAE